MEREEEDEQRTRCECVKKMQPREIVRMSGSPGRSQEKSAT